MKQTLSGTWLLDTNILVAFFDASSSHHALATAVLRSLEKGEFHGVIASQNVLELSAVLIGGYKATRDRVASDLHTLVSFPHIMMIYPTSTTVSQYITLLKQKRDVHAADIFLAATMLSSGVTSIITNDRDFEKLPELAVHNPFLT